MSENKEQKKVIKNIYRIYLVDVGAGTGKTYAISKRDLNILNQKDVKPEEILLVTFTKNVSFNMKEKVISKAKSEISKYLITAPITNFDSFGSKIIQSFGLNAPKIIGIEDQLSNYKLITENTILKKILLHSNNHARI